MVTIAHCFDGLQADILDLLQISAIAVDNSSVQGQILCMSCLSALCVS